jgi:hypothetical protein
MHRRIYRKFSATKRLIVKIRDALTVSVSGRSNPPCSDAAASVAPQRRLVL